MNQQLFGIRCSTTLRYYVVYTKSIFASVFIFILKIYVVGVMFFVRNVPYAMAKRLSKHITNSSVEIWPEVVNI